MDKILVSVAITTYNHEKFIVQCIESVLGQKTNFNFEIIIGEDHSKDRTFEICQEYQTKYPSIIKLVRGTKNLGLRKNNYQVWSHCKGKYIAYLEGDDLWTNENKLQKQVDILESDCHLMGSGHQTTLLFDHEPSNNRNFSLLEDKDRISFDRNIEKWLFATCSFVFRNFFVDENLIELRNNFNKDIYFWSDRPLMVLLAIYGDFIYLDENMGCWRQHTNNMTKIGNTIQMNIEGALAYDHIAKIYPQYKVKLKELEMRWYLLASEESYKNGKIASFFKNEYNAMICIKGKIHLKNFIKSTFQIISGRKIYA